MVLKRMRDILVATIHEGLDKIENPVVMINQYLRDMEAEIDRAKASVVKHKTLAESFMRQGRHAADMAEKRSRQAQLPLMLAKRISPERRSANENIMKNGPSITRTWPIKRAIKRPSWKRISAGCRTNMKPFAIASFR